MRPFAGAATPIKSSKDDGLGGKGLSGELGSICLYTFTTLVTFRNEKKLSEMGQDPIPDLLNKL